MRFLVFLFLLLTIQQTRGQSDYREYHQQITRFEQWIVDKQYSKAIAGFDSLFETFEFVFLRDCMLATQVSAYAGDSNMTHRFVSEGVKHGWELKKVKRLSNIEEIMGEELWLLLEAQYDSLRKHHSDRLDQDLLNKVHTLYKKDQKMALKALFRIGDKAQERYGEKKFGPHSNQQLLNLIELLKVSGYPGEKLIGNNYFASTILSHHNSITAEYNQKDTLFDIALPYLKEAFKSGEISPFEFTLIQDWRTAVSNQHEKTSYGFVGAIQSSNEREVANTNRSMLGIRSIELRNKLVDVEKNTGMKMYLPGGPWQDGKIETEN